MLANDLEWIVPVFSDKITSIEFVKCFDKFDRGAHRNVSISFCKLLSFFELESIAIKMSKDVYIPWHKNTLKSVKNFSLTFESDSTHDCYPPMFSGSQLYNFEDLERFDYTGSNSRCESYYGDTSKIVCQYEQNCLKFLLSYELQEFNIPKPFENSWNEAGGTVTKRTGESGAFGFE